MGWRFGVSATLLSVVVNLVSMTPLQSVGGDAGDASQGAAAAAAMPAQDREAEERFSVIPFDQSPFHGIVPVPGTPLTTPPRLDIAALHGVATTLAERELAHWKKQLEAGPKCLTAFRGELAENADTVLGGTDRERAAYTAMKTDNPENYQRYVAAMLQELETMQADLMRSTDETITFWRNFPNDVWGLAYAYAKLTDESRIALSGSVRTEHGPGFSTTVPFFLQEPDGDWLTTQDAVLNDLLERDRTHLNKTTKFLSNIYYKHQLQRHSLRCRLLTACATWAGTSPPNVADEVNPRATFFVREETTPLGISLELLNICHLLRLCAVGTDTSEHDVGQPKTANLAWDPDGAQVFHLLVGTEDSTDDAGDAAERAGPTAASEAGAAATAKDEHA